MWAQTGIPAVTKIKRRAFLGSAAAVMTPASNNKRQVHRFRTENFDIEMTVEFHDGYRSSGFWFRHEDSGRQYCLSARGEEDRRCLTDFNGSLAIAKYRVKPRTGLTPARSLREHVRTLDRDASLPERPPFDRNIELAQGIGSDLQAFGYEALRMDDERILRSHGPWYLFRQDLFVETRHACFLTIFWKHAFSSIRMLDMIPASGTSLVHR